MRPRRPSARRASRFASRFSRRSSLISSFFTFASAYESFTSFEPPCQPKTMQMRRIAKPTLNAVVMSCWPSEYAVAVVESV